MTQPQPNEFSIQDQHGRMYGLPVKLFTTAEGAARTLDQLEKTRRRLRDEAASARKLLDSGKEATALREAVWRWDRERERQWTVMGRHVGDWHALITLDDDRS